MINKILIFLTPLSLLWSCNSNDNVPTQLTHDYPFFVGTYTDTESQGIYVYLLKQDGNLQRIGLAAQSDNPSFLAKSADQRFLVAVNEISLENEGTVESYEITDDSLVFISRSTSGGAHPCFVAVNQAGFVLAANYTGGNVGLLWLGPEGRLTPLLDVQQHTGKGTTDRQEAPHTHSAWFSPMDNTVISVDLGTNQLWFSEVDTADQKLRLSDPNTFTMKPGAGPRHLAFHPHRQWIYVVNELDCTIALLEGSGNSYVNHFTISTLPAGYAEPNTCADIRVSSDGKFVYASNRGHNSIAMYEVNEDGTLNLLGHEATRGDGPRNFSLSPDDNHLLVANQQTGNIVSFKRDQSTGRLTYVGQIEAPTPVCIVF